MVNAVQSPSAQLQTVQPQAAENSTVQAQPQRVITVDDHQFDELIMNSELPVLVDIWAPWCGPCRLVSPVVDAIASTYKGRLQVAKLNVDENPDTATRYEVRSIPTLLLFEQGQVVERLTGAVTRSRLTEMVEQHLA